MIDRTEVKEDRNHRVRVLQFGEGCFLRAFVDWMIDIANERGATDTRIAIVSPRFGDGRAVRTLKTQQGVYHVVLEGMADSQPKREIRMISSIADVMAPVFLLIWSDIRNMLHRRIFDL